MRFDLLKRSVAAAVSAVVTLSVITPACTAFAASETLYSYSFEDDKLPTVENGGAEYEIKENIGSNETKVLKIEKKSTETGTKDSRVQIYPLGSDVDVTEANKYINVKFKIYPTGTGFSAFTLTNGSVNAIHTAVPASKLTSDEWNDVEIMTTITFNKNSGSNSIYDASTSIKINGETAVSDTKEVKQSKDLNGLFEFRLKLESEKGKTFTAYIDDIATTTVTATEPALKDSDSYTADDKAGTLTVEEGTTAAKIVAAAGSSVKITRGSDELASDDALANGDKVTVSNAVGVQKVYTVTLVKPDYTPKIEAGSGYTADGKNITLTSDVSAADMTMKRATSVKVYSDMLKTTELSADDILSAGNIIVLSNEHETAVYKVVSDKNTLYYNDFDNGDTIAFSNATSYVDIKYPTGVAGKDDDDKSAEIPANEIGDNSSVRCCKAALIAKADATKKHFKVDFSILPNDEKFATVSLAGGWTVEMTNTVSVGDNGLVRDKWNRVSFVLDVGEMYIDGERSKFDVTSTIYVNGELYSSNNTKTTNTVNPNNTDALLPIMIRLNNTDRSDDTYTVYIDDICVTSPSAQAKMSVKNAAAGGESLIKTNTEFVFSSNYGFDSSAVTADAIKLNGEKLADGSYELAVKNGTAKLKLNGLQNGTVYKLTVDKDAWKDSFGRDFGATEFKFETESSVKVGKAKFDKTKLSEGRVTVTVASLENTTGTKQNAELIMTLFKDGKLVKISSATTEIPANGTVTDAACSIEVPDTSDGEYILRCFFWDSLSGRVSYADGISIAE